MLHRHVRRRLVDGLSERYRDYAQLAGFLILQLDRRLAMIAASGPLPLVVLSVVESAQAQGWLDELVEAAADDSPHSPALQEVRAALRRRTADPTRPSPAASGTGADPEAITLDLVLVVPPLLAPLADALRADARVGRVGAAPTAAAPDLAGADALVVSTEVTWPDAHALPAALHALPVVVVASPSPAAGTPTAGTPTAGAPVAHLLAGSVTQIVAPGAPRDTARRIVDHLAAVVGWQRRNQVPNPQAGG